MPFLRELAPPCTIGERRSRDGGNPVNPAGFWSKWPLDAFWRFLDDGCHDRTYGNYRNTLEFLRRAPHLRNRMVLLQPTVIRNKRYASSVQCRSLLLLLALVGLMFVGLLAQSALLDYLPHWASNAAVAVVFTIPYFDVVPRPCVLHLIKQPLTAFDKQSLTAVAAQNKTPPLSCRLSAKAAESPQKLCSVWSNMTKRLSKAFNDLVTPKNYNI